jgi:RNA polymerase sigma-70 factor, ECF subfamily
MAFLVVLESMTPAERVALILHDVFGYPFATVTGDIGLAPAALPGPLHGAEQIARACLAVISQAPGLTLLERTVNGQPGLVAQQDGVTMAVYAFQIASDRIKHIWAILDPGKLRSWTTA